MNTRTTHVLLVLTTVLAALSMAGCGGGGGGGGGGDAASPPVASPPAPPPPTATAPVLTAMPTAQTAAEGQTATFSVSATGTAPLAYQWRRDGVAIAGATAASYTTPALAAADNGVAFSVLVSNTAGSVASASAVLTVTPAAVALPVPLAAGPLNSAAVTSAGQVLIWGSNAAGLFANGSAVAGTNAVGLPLGARAISVGLQGAVAVTRDGQVLGWGTSGVGALGDVSASPVVGTPRSLPGLSPSRAALFAESMTLSIKSDGSLWHLPGVATAAPGGATVTARAVAGLTGVASLVRTEQASGPQQLRALAIKDDGSVWTLSYVVTAAGSSFTYTVSANPLAGLPPVRSASCAATHCVFLLADGRVFTRGDNGDGQLGDGTRSASTAVAVQALGLSNIRAVAALQRASVAVGEDGRLWTWGDSGYHGRSNTGIDTLLPTPLAGVTGVTALAAGSAHVLYLRSDGSVWGWGDNSNGELGDGTRDPREQPVQSIGINLN